MTAITELPLAVQVISSLSSTIATIIIPIILAVLGSRYTHALKEKEIKAKLVELALDQLKISPTKDNENIRKWSIDVIGQFSGVPLSEAAKDDLVNKVGLVGKEEISSSNDSVDPLERKIFSEVSSAGQQLGWLTDVILGLSDGKEPDPGVVKRLKDLKSNIDYIKQREKRYGFEAALDALDKLEKSQPATYSNLIQERSNKLN